MSVDRVDLRYYRGEPDVRVEEVARRRDFLVVSGFGDDWIASLAVERPSLYSRQVVGEHLDGLYQRGFADPVKMITSLPAILGYGFENIDDKLKGLRQRGFADPVKMITSSPAILGYGFENIDDRLRLFERLIRMYELPFSAVSLMERESALFSSKIDKILVLARILRDYRVMPPELNGRVLSRLVRANLEDVLIALARKELEGESILDLINRANRVKKERLSRQEKRQVIDEDLGDLDKVRRRYFRGYLV